MILAGIVLATVAAATSVHLPVSTANAAAQAAVDRGLFLYYAYNGDAAVASFERAAELDPNLAMAYWGVALASGPDLNTAQSAQRFDRAARAIRRAGPLEAGASPLERGLVAAMAQRYRGTFADWAGDDAAYGNAMLALARDSHDENAALLAAEALLESGGLTWSQGTLASENSRQALQIVTGIVQTDPQNPMGDHLCIHLYDLAPDRGAALPCAQRLDATAFSPEAEHLAHMPAHYWIETGNYAAALASSDRAYSLLAQLQGGGSKHAEQYAKHDVSVGYSAAMMLGNYAVAQRWALHMTGVFDQNFDALTALRFGRYATAYAADAAAFDAASVRGLAALQLGRTSEAKAIGARVAAANPTRGYVPQLFLARLAESEGNVTDAVRWIARSRDNQRADYSGELIPWLPAGEALGELYLRAGDAGRAATAFADTLATYPNDPRALFGLASALSAQGERTKANAAHAEFDKGWKGADTDVRDALL